MDNRINNWLESALQAQANQQRPRDYLGASQLGDVCDRRIQYQYWGITPDHPLNGQQLQTFALGHHLEKLVIHWIQQAGFELSTGNINGKPYGFSIADGSIAGHIDGILRHGPDTFAYPALWECKSMNNKSWRDCVRRGVQLSHPQYYAQIQLYMAYIPLDEHPALLTVLNKDTATLYHEWIEFDASVAQRYSDRAVNILKACRAQETLPRVAQDPHHFICKMCRFKKTCWEKRI